MSGAPLRCTVCGAADVLAAAPGQEDEIAPGGIVIRRGVPVQAWCRACWPALARISAEAGQ